jgi:hypothetical protein
MAAKMTRWGLSALFLINRTAAVVLIHTAGR